jgi:O-antigen/teichoic acid export membrane protein
MQPSVLARVGRQSWAYALYSVVGPGTALLLLPVYTRYLSPAEFGLIAVLEVVALILSAVFSLGLTALVPFLYVDYDGEYRKRAMGTLVVAVTLINTGLAAVALAAAPSVVAVVFPSIPVWPYLPLIIVTALIEPYWVMAGSSLQIQEKAGRFAAWSTARIVVAIVSKLVFVVWLVGGAVGFTIANLVTASAFAAAAFWVMRTEVAPGFSPKIIREGFKIGGPTVPNNLLSYGFRLLDRVVLERFVSLEQVGLYYLALRLADVMRLAGDVLINAWRPVFFKEADDDTFKRQDVPRMIRIATVALASVFVMLSVFSREVVVLFAAPTYRSASAFVPFLAGAMFLKGFQSFPYLTIWLRRKTAWVPLLSVLTLLVSIAANVLFARRWGAMGVAAALVVAYGFLTIMMFAVSRRLYDAVYPWRTLFVVGALTLASVSMSALLPDAPLSILAKFGIVIGYASALVATGCIQMAELRALVLTDGIPALLRRKAAVS